MRRFIIYSSFFFILIVAVIIFIQSRAFSEAEEVHKGCTSCHQNLRTVLPKYHVPVKHEEIAGCLSCHRTGIASNLARSMHYIHYATPRFSDDCWSCHGMNADGYLFITGTQRNKKVGTRDDVNRMTPYVKSWASSNLVDHLHAVKKVGCQDCHDTIIPEKTISSEQCLKCHKNYENVAEMTKSHPDNPHSSHAGIITCFECHRVHKKSVLNCNQCHSFDMEVPSRREKGK